MSVSVVVPCYNYARFLDACVGSVISQPGVRVEVLVIDDASTDDTPEVSRRLAMDPRVEVRRHQRNRGHIATYNEGLSWARGDLTVLLSADDMLAPGALERAARVFSANPTVGLVYGRAVSWSGATPLPTHRRSGASKVWRGHDWLESRCRLGRVAIVSPEVVVRTALQQRLGGYRADLPHSGDSEMWLRFGAVADVAYVDAEMAYYRVHSQAMSKAVFNSTLVDAEQRAAAFTAGLARASDVEYLQALAMRGLAAEVLWGVCRAYDRGLPPDSGTAELVDFGHRVHPDSAPLAEHRRLALRQAVRRALGPRAARALARIMTPDLVRHRLRQLRWQYGRLWWRHLSRV